MRADQALRSQGNFNAELRWAVLAIVEETNIKAQGQGATVYNKIKDWVTSSTMLIHEKGGTPFRVPNTLHFVQCANERDSCPVDFGDTRIVAIEVPPLKRGTEIPKEVLIEQLRAEAPDFLGIIMRMELPQPSGRLGIKIIETSAKTQMCSVLQGWADECLVTCDGQSVHLDKAIQSWESWAVMNGKTHAFTPRSFAKEMRDMGYVVGQKVVSGYANPTVIGNVILSDGKIIDVPAQTERLVRMATGFLLGTGTQEWKIQKLKQGETIDET
jgi:hypothetical protein